MALVSPATGSDLESVHDTRDRDFTSTRLDGADSSRSRGHHQFTLPRLTETLPDIVPFVLVRWRPTNAASAPQSPNHEEDRSHN